MKTVMARGVWSEPKETPFLESVDEIIAHLQPALEGKDVDYFAFDPLQLMEHPALASVVDRLMRWDMERVCLFQVDARGFAVGTELLASRNTREVLTIEAMMIAD